MVFIWRVKKYAKNHPSSCQILCIGVKTLIFMSSEENKRGIAFIMQKASTKWSQVLGDKNPF